MVPPASRCTTPWRSAWLSIPASCIPRAYTSAWRLRETKRAGETIAARKGFMLEFKEGHGVRTVVGRTELKPNTKVCVEVDANRFIRFFVQRVLTASATQE